MFSVSDQIFNASKKSSLPFCIFSEWFFAHISQQWSIGWVAQSFLVRCCTSSRYGDTRPNLHSYLNKYRHKSPILTQYHLIPSSTKYWPSTTKYQPVPPHTDSVPPISNQYCLLLTQYHHLSTNFSLVPPSTNQFRLLLTQYHHIWTSTAPYGPSTNKHSSRLTQYYQVPNSTALNWPSIMYHIPISDFPLSTSDEQCSLSTVVRWSSSNLF